MQTQQLTAKKLIQNHLAEAQRQLAAAEKLAGENHIFNYKEMGRLNDLVDEAHRLLSDLGNVEE